MTVPFLATKGFHHGLLALQSLLGAHLDNNYLPRRASRAVIRPAQTNLSHARIFGEHDPWTQLH